MTDDHYLKKELYNLVKTDSNIFDFLQMGSLDGIWYWDLENPEVEWMSSRFWEVFGYDWKTKKHLASEWQDIIHPEDLKVALDNFDKHCVDPNHPYDQYVRYRHKDGHTVWVRCRGMAIRDEEGKPLRMLGAHTDVTALKLSEEKVQKLAKDLARANKELESFSFSASHNLKTPLRTIDGFSRILAENYADRLDPEGQRILGVVRESARKMGRLIDDLLSFSKINHQAIAVQKVEMTDLARSAFYEVASLEPGREIDFQISSMPAVSGDPAMLRQVWVNLLSNAIKYTRPRAQAQIKVQSLQKEEETVFSIQDNGVGFQSRYADKLFAAFQRLHNENEFEGSGIGLAIVHKIVERHGGRIWAESAGSDGSTFQFSLPLKSVFFENENTLKNT